jgi:hypothetical protein
MGNDLVESTNVGCCAPQIFRSFRKLGRLNGSVQSDDAIVFKYHSRHLRRFSRRIFVYRPLFPPHCCRGRRKSILISFAIAKDSSSGIAPRGIPLRERFAKNQFHNEELLAVRFFQFVNRTGAASA